MSNSLSRRQIDALGKKLKDGRIAADDIRYLDEYRRTFEPAYDMVIDILRNKLNLRPTGRPAKSTNSILEKLRRQTIKLSQIQDIAGCRVVVSDVFEQDRLVESIIQFWSPAIKVTDRRKNPSYGYRAMHLIPTIGDKKIEIQLRTILQHLWAQLSEKLADIYDPSIKYGGGTAELRDLLDMSSSLIGDIETDTRDIKELDTSIEDMELNPGITNPQYIGNNPTAKAELRSQLATLQEGAASRRTELEGILNKTIEILDKARRDKS